MTKESHGCRSSISEVDRTFAARAAHASEFEPIVTEAAGRY